MPIMYHAPSRGFVISYQDLQSTADSILSAMCRVRMGAGLPLAASIEDPATPEDSHAVSALLALMSQAQGLGIDLGADRWYKLDVRAHQ